MPIKLLTVTLLLLAATVSQAQILTVHVVNESNAPIGRVPVFIRYNFTENRKPLPGELVGEKTNSAGDALFPAAHVDAGGFSILAGGTCDIAKTTPYFLFSRPEPKLTSPANPVFTTLPARVTVVVYRRGIGECLRWILSGGS